MIRTPHSSLHSDADWRAVCANRPCPVCASVEGPCWGHVEKQFASCARTPSDWPMTNGAWLHRLAENEGPHGSAS